MDERTTRARAAQAADAAATDRPLLSRLTETLEEAGIFVAAELDGKAIVLSGEVDTDESRQAALDVATAIARPHGLQVEDAMDVLDISPDEPFGGRDAAPAVGGAEFEYADPDTNPDARLDPTFELEPDFDGDVGTTDSEESVAEAVPYFPPTDPVVRPSSDEEQLEVVGGFEATSMDDLDDAAAYDERPDDELAQDVQRELREDALTTDLTIRVSAAAGVVFLRGEVPALEDADNAEEVASRVDGVKEVREELHVRDLEQQD